VQMREVFSDVLSLNDRSGPILVARVTNVYMASSGGHSRNSTSGNDNIEGDGIVLCKRRVVQSAHVLTELSPSYSGPFYNLSTERLRYDSIAFQFAYWLRRELGL
jgi:hypothetical protein